MRKVFLSLVAVLLCSVSVFAQSDDIIFINSEEEFLAINGEGNYRQMRDLDLGDLGVKTSAIISELNGSYDGNGYAIRYTAHDSVTSAIPTGLFGEVSGTIKNLNITATKTVYAPHNVFEVPFSLLCGRLESTGTIQNCRAINCAINSTIQNSNGKGIYCGMLVGELQGGSILYCTGTGNVTANGAVGGLVGSATGGTIKGCSFSGSITGAYVGSTKDDRVGGICGEATNSTNISFCFVDATIDGQFNYCGVVCGNYGATGNNETNPTVGNVYAEGTVNGNDIDSSEEITSSSSVTGLYYENYSGWEAQDIVDALNTAKGDDANFYFVVINGKVAMVVGSIVCEAPRNLRTERVEGQGYTYNITWEAPAEVDNSFLESSHGNYQWTVAETANGMIGSETGTVGHDVFSLQHTLTGDALTYRVAIQTVCGNTRSGEISVVINKQNDCKVEALQVSDIAYTSATATWEGNASKYIVRLVKDLEQVSDTVTTNTTISFSNLVEGGNYTLTVIANCANENETIVEGNNATANFTTKRLNFETAQSGKFGDPSTWVGGVVPSAPANITINRGHVVTLHGNLILTENFKIKYNYGVLAVYQDAQLVNTTSTNVPGIVEINAIDNGMNAWTFIGAPFAGYKLGAVKPVSGSDIAMVKYDYTNGAWGSDWAHVLNTVKAAEGTFAWPFYNGTTTYTTYGDLCTWSETEERWVAGSYDFDRTPAHSLNNGTVTVTETISTTSSNDNWMALANPYPAKLSAELFLAGNTNAGIQGECVYVFRDGSFDINTNHLSSGDIFMTEGFFVNFANGGEKSVTFNKEQLSIYLQPSGQKTSSSELIELTLVNGKDKVRAYFAHNEDAEQGYDIFDANKMFATTGVAEPYFVTDGIALIKEEVAELPYYATMNVRSQQDTVMNFVLTNLPEGYAVSIIDGEEVIDMVEGGVYSTEILTGENADRFKVLVKKNVGIADVKDLDVTITNNNRHITITSQEDVKVEVYNTLGQRVFETSETNFVLSGVASGAYVVKAYNKQGAKTQKIIVE